ncbi:MAG: carbohydrate-binding protein [Clostridiales bacterium]|nr:carbohydrate-binding protein [Clostridiales bacterium]
MRKLLAILLCCTMIFAILAVSSSAASNSAFDKEFFRIKKGNACVLFDNIDNTGGSAGNAFCYAENYGTGRNDKGDLVAYDDVDFGSKGAVSVTVNFGYHKTDPKVDEPTTFAIYIDTPYGNPIATFSVTAGTTKGSEIVHHLEFTKDVQVAAGVHDVYFMATNTKSGSFDYIYFKEAGSKIEATKTVESDIKYDALNPFTTMNVTAKTIMIDQIDTMSQGGSGKPIAYVAGYGCGYSSLDDMVVFPNCNFGKNGAKAFAIKFGFGKEGATTKVNIYVDNPYGKPAAELEIGPTGGWKAEDDTQAKVITGTINVEPGIHTILVRFMNDQSGSFSQLSFVEGDPRPETTAKAAAASSPAAAAQTADFIVIPAVIALVSVIGLKVSNKRD